MHNVSLPTFQQLARHVVDSLPSMELSFNVPDVLAQWVAGVVQVGGCVCGRGSQVWRLASCLRSHTL
jgi:hypothetical protein